MFTYMQGGTFTVTLRVTDTSGATDTDTLTITVTSGPVGPIDSPAAAHDLGAGESISFSGAGTDADGGALPASALDWAVVLAPLRRRPDCHEHQLGDLPGHRRAARSPLPTTPQPGEIEVRLTATDSERRDRGEDRRRSPRAPSTCRSARPPPGRP